ncbi:hypothetical protein LH51_17635 [Nitrincola sp. A-D6]|uniref:hypothetical protein n=1 Tax=Nitrincola sp. A-D6 TaxID=1545442 RepID=UPI00051FCD45|nr:hypothetical protein [Nitrincola sp. A-D6]KGK41048.1 hypothetical protein LH51_17635 [Nitrincola sp. A-D6]
MTNPYAQFKTEPEVNPYAQFTERKAQPENPYAQFKEDEDKTSLGEYATDAGRGLVHGLKNAVVEAANFGYETLREQTPFRRNAPEEFQERLLQAESIGEIWSINREARKAMGQDRGLADAINKGFGYLDEKGVIPEAVQVDKPETAVGKGVEGITQFLTAFIGGYKLAGSNRHVTEAGHKVRRFLSGKQEVAKAAVVSGGAGAVAFDPYGDTISTAVNELAEVYPTLKNPITEWLDTSEGDDSVGMARIKHAIEEMGVGVVSDVLIIGIVRAFKSAKAIRETDGDEAADAFLREQMEEADKAAKEAKALHTEATNLPARVEDVPAYQTADEAAEAETTREAARQAEEAAKGGKHYLADGVEVTPEIASDFLKFFEARRGTSYRGRENAYRVGGSNNDADRAYMEMGDHIAGRANHASSYVKHNADTIREAEEYLQDITGNNLEELKKTLAQDARQAEEQTTRLVAAKRLASSMSRDLMERMTRITERGSEVTDRELLEATELLADLQELKANIMGVTTWSARNVQAGRIHTVDSVTGKALSDAKVREALSQLGGSQAVKDILETARKRTMKPKYKKFFDRLKERMKREGYSQAEINAKVEAMQDKILLRESQKTFLEKFVGDVNTYYINSLLSGVGTQQINFLSAAIRTLALPMEKIIGGVGSGNMKQAKEGIRLYVGMGRAIRESVSDIGAVVRTVKDNENPATALAATADVLVRGVNRLDIDHRMLDYDQGLTAKQWGIQNKVGKTAFDTAGYVAKTPSRFLGGMDEFFKQINYRAVTYAEIKRAAEMLPVDEREAFEQLQWREAFSATGAGNRESGLEYARRVTFTGDLEYGVGKSIQDVFNKHPALRFMMPFIRTPINIFRDVWASTPVLNYGQRQWREKFNGTKEQRAEAVAQMFIGMSLYGAAFNLAFEGKLQGALSTDPNQRKLQQEAGILPYSYIYEDEEGNTKYWQFNRLDPWAMFFGLVADGVHLYENEEFSDANAMELSAGILTALIQNLSSKSTLVGLTSALEAMQDPERNMEYFIGQTASGFVPNVSKDIGELFGHKDEYFREVWTFADRFKNKLPVLNETLMPKRSWITGEPMARPSEGLRTTHITHASTNPVIQEMNELGHGFGAPPKKIGNVELKPEQYDRFMELHGTVQVRGMTMVQRLENEMQKSRYVRTPKLSYEGESYHVRVFQSVISGYRQAALKQLRDEFSDLNENIRIDRRNASHALKGQEDKITKLIE